MMCTAPKGTAFVQHNVTPLSNAFASTTATMARSVYHPTVLAMPHPQQPQHQALYFAPEGHVRPVVGYATAPSASP